MAKRPIVLFTSPAKVFLGAIGGERLTLRSFPRTARQRKWVFGLAKVAGVQPK
jgi:hypothetical protein